MPVAGHPLEERPPGAEQLVAPPAGALADAEQRQQRRLDPAPLGLVGHVRVRRVSATFAGVVVSASSVSSSPARARTISPSAQNVMPSP